jgi:primosomal protein N' (replication factor Y) (superfamily II helicase)
LTVVRVLPDEPAINKSFDYLVPDPVGDQVRVGDRVRIALQGRRVGGWVVATGVEPPAGVVLRPIAKWSGRGPTPELIDLAGWAAWRWAGRPASLLRTASPERVVRGLPAAPHRLTDRALSDAAGAVGPVHEALARDLALLRLPPASDPSDVALAAAGRGNALVLCPTMALARSIAARLRASGVPVALHPRDWALGAAGATVVGTRAAAWAPVGDLVAVLVVDEHDERHQQEQAPTWHARDVAVERTRRAGVPCVLTSPCPSLEALGLVRGALSPSRSEERAGWPIVDVVDLRREDPRTGLLPPALVRLLRSDRRVLCVLNRTGRARLLACKACGELARCERCDAAVAQPGDELVCGRCGATRPVVCLACGATRLRTLRQGVTRVRDEIEALVGEPVDEVTRAKPLTSDRSSRGARVIVGTEATLHQVDRADVVAFLDFDQELLARRYRAAEQAFGLLARAARVVGPKAGGGRVVVQTHLPRHEVVQAALHADPSRVATAERERRELLRFPPVTAMAEVSGAGAGAFAEALGHPLGVAVLGPSEGRWLVRAPDHATLCDALAATPRPPGRLRVAVDPPRV